MFSKGCVKLIFVIIRTSFRFFLFVVLRIYQMPLVKGHVKWKRWRTIIPMNGISCRSLINGHKRRNNYESLSHHKLPHGGILSSMYHNLIDFGITSAISG